MKYSDCCEAPMSLEMEDFGICPECKEHCGIYDDEDEDEELEDMCSHCGGTGEGQYDGSRCSVCKGTGTRA